MTMSALVMASPAHTQTTPLKQDPFRLLHTELQPYNSSL